MRILISHYLQQSELFKLRFVVLTLKKRFSFFIIWNHSTINIATERRVTERVKSTTLLFFNISRQKVKDTSFCCCWCCSFLVHHIYRNKNNNTGIVKGWILLFTITE